mmetsp:Transcript_4047/g.6002  ORF Transcript_4047/g.6002 Transcript_4047/m.6002 type:complete len:278 (-) Transcript_4047:229-1062(-)
MEKSEAAVSETAYRHQKWPNDFLLNSYTSRTFLEVKVAKTWSLHVYILMRHRDLPWFHSDIAYHEEQLLHLIKEFLIPKEFPDLFAVSDIHEDDINGITTTTTEPSTNKSNNQNNIVGEKNIQQLRKKRKGTAATYTKNNRSKKTTVTKSAAQSSKIKTAVAFAGKISSENVKNSNKIRDYKSDVGMLFGETLQITYRMENVTNASFTLLYKNDNKDEKLASFISLKTLPRSLVLWCYPLDIASPTKPNPDDSGFPRPEMIPITCLFQQRRDEETQE